ncbi:MAG: tyrosine--tRNA ligase [Buchnera aphidicola (Tetraneura akinire)]|nr:tyrosine--tRNA ligase [Buchnera sp. (in: enterobacteria)]
MMFKNIIDELKLRNLIFQISDEKKIVEEIKSSNLRSVYCGFDSTADSLHLGHLIPLLVLKRFQNFGFIPIIVIGGATSLIGDPSFKRQERVLNTVNDIKNWNKKISLQISSFLNNNNQSNNAIILNNYDWFKKMEIIYFLREIGKHYSINKMISRDSVRERINRIGHGISFTEFSYSLLQSYDFYILHEKYKVCLQIGGSDQWGNIVSGIHLIKRLSGKQAFGLTVPLFVNSSGEKMGKSQGKPIWLDSTKTTPYLFYQFWINIEDKDVYSFFKWFTFYSYKNIKKMEFENNKKYDFCFRDRIKLAKTITKLVHGESAMRSAVRITECLFFGSIEKLQISDFEQLEKDGLFSVKIKGNITLKEALVISKLCSSRTQAKQMIFSNAISINMKKVLNENHIITNNEKLFNRFTLLQKGKKHFSLLCWE